MQTRTIQILLAIVAFLSPFVVPRVKTLLAINGYRRDWTNKNTDRCTQIHPNVLQGCEDIHLYESGAARYLFAICSEDMEKRKLWFPGIAHRSDPGIHIVDKLFALNLDNDELTYISFQGFKTDFVSHGFDVIGEPNSPRSVALYAINHLPSGSVVEKFVHTLGTDTAKHVRTFDDQKHVFTPNDLHVVDVVDDRFYVTNDHMFKEGLKRDLELILQLPTTSIAMHSNSAHGYKIVQKSMKGINGITGDRKGKIYVMGLAGAKVHVMDVLPDGNLKLLQDVNLGFAPDNPSISMDTRELIVAGHPFVLEVLDFAKNTEKKTASSIVARIPLAQLGPAFFGGEGASGSSSVGIQPVVTEFFLDSGAGVMNASTTCVVDAKNDVFYVTSAFGYSIAKCAGYSETFEKI